MARVEYVIEALERLDLLDYQSVVALPEGFDPVAAGVTFK